MDSMAVSDSCNTVLVKDTVNVEIITYLIPQVIYNHLSTSAMQSMVTI